MRTCISIGCIMSFHWSYSSCNMTLMRIRMAHAGQVIHGFAYWLGPHQVVGNVLQHFKFTNFTAMRSTRSFWDIMSKIDLAS
jgi:hypothetical protein